MENQNPQLSEEEKIRQYMQLKRAMLREGMTSEARERLGRVRTANPEFASRVEMVCLQAIQQGKHIDDATLKQVLEKLGKKREFKITRR